MDIILTIGSDYNKPTFSLPVDDAITVMNILKGKGVTYEADKMYKYIDTKVVISSEDHSVIKKAIKPIMPPQIDDEINDI